MSFPGSSWQRGEVHRDATLNPAALFCDLSWVVYVPLWTLAEQRRDGSNDFRVEVVVDFLMLEPRRAVVD
jgi:hypothetical protein